MKEWMVDKLTIKVLPDRQCLGMTAAQDIAAQIRLELAKKREIRLIFAAAPSQNETLADLVQMPDINWRAVHAYHMDEYIGLPSHSPHAFGSYLKEHIFDLLPFGSIHYIDPSAADPDAEAIRYGTLFDAAPADLVIMGIGENGHIAFNDPPVADFHDPRPAKPVVLDLICRAQQVHDGCFETLAAVPTHAITLTVPTLFRAAHLFCVVPGRTKAPAVAEMLHGTVDEHCPASVLRHHPHATLYLGAGSEALL